MIECLRCLYKVYLHFHEGTPYDSFLTPSARKSLVRLGIDFEERIAPTIEIQGSVDIEREREADLLVRAAELMRSHDLWLQCRPDGIATEMGALVPIEIKYHRRVLRSDRLKLAFYWKLLEPLRVGYPDPKGYTVLTNGELVEVELKRRAFNKLDQYLVEVRRIREEECELAIVPECKSCVYGDQHAQMVRNDGDLSLVCDIGRPRCNWLLQLGIKMLVT